MEKGLTIYFLNKNDVTDVILITRPIQQARSLCTKLSNLGYSTRIYPLLNVVFDFQKIENINFNQYDVMIVSSSNTASMLLQANVKWDKPCYVVGFKTASILKQILINPSYIAHESQELYLEITRTIPTSKSILYLSGQYIAFDFAFKLQIQGFHIKNEQVYKTSYQNEIPNYIMDGITTVLFYSPKTAEAFATICNYDLKNINAICISDNAALKTKHLNFKGIVVSAKPNENEMMKCLTKI